MKVNEKTNREKLTKMGWWILTTTIGWTLAWLGVAFYNGLFAVVETPLSPGYFLVAATALGAIMGAMQWWLLRTQVPHASWWIPK